MTAQATCAAPSPLDLLLGAEVVSIKANLPTARYEIPRLSEAAGAPVVFTLRALPYGRVQELKRLAEEADIQILLAGCVEPDLKAAALQEKFQGVTPAETVKAMLLPGEIADLAIAVEKLSGYRRTTIEEVKTAEGSRGPGAGPGVLPVRSPRDPAGRLLPAEPWREGPDLGLCLL